jgi:hypothetical protein
MNHLCTINSIRIGQNTHMVSIPWSSFSILLILYQYLITLPTIISLNKTTTFRYESMCILFIIYISFNTCPYWAKHPNGLDSFPALLSLQGGFLSHFLGLDPSSRLRTDAGLSFNCMLVSWGLTETAGSKEIVQNFFPEKFRNVPTVGRSFVPQNGLRPEESCRRKFGNQR